MMTVAPHEATATQAHATANAHFMVLPFPAEP
jgi:hypothetical protein